MAFQPHVDMDLIEGQRKVYVSPYNRVVASTQPAAPTSTFPFMKLPLELRREVYEILISEPMNFFVGMVNPLGLPDTPMLKSPYIPPTSFKTALDTKHSFFPLLLVSKQIYAELNPFTSMMSTNVVDGRLIQFISEDFSAMCANGRFLFDHDPKAQAALQFVSNQSHHTRSHIRSIVFGKNFLWSIDPHIQDGEHYVIWGEPGDEVYYQHILHQPDWILSSLPELREISFYIPLGHDDTHCSMVLMDFIEHMKYRDFEDRTVEVIRFMFVENLDEAFQPLLCRHLKDPLKLLDCCALEEGCMKNHWGATREVNYHPVVAFEGRAINEEEALSKYGWKHARTVFSIRWVSTSVLLM